MKKILLMLMLMANIVYANVCSAYVNEPDGFRGIKWGVTLEEVKNSGVFESGIQEVYNMDGMAFYNATLVNKSMCGIPGDGYTQVFFYNNRFYAAKVWLGNNSQRKESGFQLCKKAKTEMVDLFGVPENDTVERLALTQSQEGNISYYPTWTSNVSTIFIEYYETFGTDRRSVVNCDIQITSTQIQNEIDINRNKNLVKKSGF